MGVVERECKSYLAVTLTYLKYSTILHNFNRLVPDQQNALADPPTRH